MMNRLLKRIGVSPWDPTEWRELTDTQQEGLSPWEMTRRLAAWLVIFLGLTSAALITLNLFSGAL